jgi:hypothetical protein
VVLDACEGVWGTALAREEAAAKPFMLPAFGQEKSGPVSSLAQTAMKETVTRHFK